jgi:hypothetical protein
MKMTSWLKAAETEEPATPRRGERFCLTNADVVAPDGQCLAK